jgi:radical SAM protein with 4Fe4S-binding SPASM domain
MINNMPFFNLQVELNDVCNLECRHCYQTRAKIKEDLNIDFVLEQAEELKKVTGYNNYFFRLSGGEVTLRKDLFKVIRKISNRGYFVEVITNGIFLDLPYVFALKAAGVNICQVSLDGGSAEIHDFVRGKGAFDKTIKGIKNLVKAGIVTEIKFTLIKGLNTNDISNMFNLCSDLGVKYVSLGRFIFAGNGLKNFSDGNLIGEEMKDIFYKIINIGGEYPNLIIRIRDQLVRIVSDIEVPENVHASQKPYIGVNYLALDTYGNVYADRQLGIVIGNIHKKSMAKIWASSRKLKQLKGGLHYLRGKCVNCSIKNICMGGNKTAAFALTGSPFEPDPGCWLNEPTSCKDN